MSDRGQDTSSELSEVRTVHSRAANALEWMERYAERDVQWDGKTPTKHDPEDREMIAALQEVVRILEPWKRTRKARRRT